jgi:nucleoid-associated protein YgaU
MATEKNIKKVPNLDQISEIFKDKSTTSIVVATVILLLLSFFTFRYFGSNDINDSLNGDGASDIVLEGEYDETVVGDDVSTAQQEVKDDAVFEEPEYTEENTVSKESAESEVTTAPEETEQVQEEDKKGFRELLSGLFAGKKEGENTVEEGAVQSADQDSMDKGEDVDSEGSAVDGVFDYNDSVWVANDLTPNSLKGETHSVQQGDTLWEIAEAYYGNGADWTKIAQANSVSYNMQGNPLIYAGTTITIPQM